MVLRSRFVPWLLVGLVLAACGSSEEKPKASGSSGASGQGTSGQGAGSSGIGGHAGGGAAGMGGGAGAGAGATSRGGSGDAAGDGGSDDAPSSGGTSASGKGGSVGIDSGGSGNAGGTQSVPGAGSGNESQGGDGASSLDACLGDVARSAFPPPCTTASVPLDDEVAPCEFSMPKPSGVSLDYSRFNVTYTSELGSSFVPRLSGSASCDDPPGSGFYYGDKAEPVSIVLCPCTCAAAKAGAGELDALYGCPTFIR